MEKLCGDVKYFFVIFNTASRVFNAFGPVRQACALKFRSTKTA